MAFYYPNLFFGGNVGSRAGQPYRIDHKLVTQPIETSVQWCRIDDNIQVGPFETLT